MDFQGYGTQPTYVDEMMRLRNALAEKDKEIAKWQLAHDDMVRRNRLLRDRPNMTIERERSYDELMQAYHTLMAQAVRFAEYLQETIDSGDVGGLGMYEQVQSFLASPEVREWREREGLCRGMQ